MTTGQKRALMTESCFSAACQNGNLFYLFSSVQFNDQRNSISVLLLTGVLKVLKGLGLYNAIFLVSYNLLLGWLALRRLHEID